MEKSDNGNFSSELRSEETKVGHFDANKKEVLESYSTSSERKTQYGFSLQKKCLYLNKSDSCKSGSKCEFAHQAAKNHQHHFKKYPYTNSQYYDKCTKYSHLKNECLSSTSKIPNTGAEYPTIEHSEILDDITESTVSEEAFFLNREKYLLPYRNKKEISFCTLIEKTTQTKSTPLCYYFKKGYCYRGERCKFYHPQRGPKHSDRLCFSKTTKDSNTNLQAKLLKTVKNSNTVSQTETLHSNHEDCNTNKLLISKNASHVYELAVLAPEDISKLRATEIMQLKKRFPHCEEILKDATYAFIFEPSDPDWPFDVRKIRVEVNFPESYPKEKCSVAVIKHAENIPDLLIKFLNKAVSDWITTRYNENIKFEKVEMIFRPFLKWLDKSLEELFICGLKKVKQDMKAKEDGIEFVPVESLFPSSTKDTDSDCSNSKESDNVDGIPNLVSIIPQTSVSNSKLPTSHEDLNHKQFHYIGNNVMKILFLELELIEGAAALICKKVSLMLQCCRCKNTFHAQSVPKKNNTYVCSKCSKNVGFTLEPFTVHQFSNVLGNLYLLDCVAVDINLIECQFLVDCLSCSKQVSVDGIHYGQKHKLWCTFCHGKMIINIGSSKFQTLKQSPISDFKSVAIKKSEKKVKDPVVKEGEPLPNFGACKHYKKSFRWLRFPCCGRLYPCDECHNEKETDHEMKYASRMICGFCSKEQPYSQDKSCILCSQNMTKKSGSHWEGGKGCRNKLQMNREDRQKYIGVCKTVSKKAQRSSKEKK